MFTMQDYWPGSALSNSCVFSICPEADRRVTCLKTGSF